MRPADSEQIGSEQASFPALCMWFEDPRRRQGTRVTKLICWLSQQSKTERRTLRVKISGGAGCVFTGRSRMGRKLERLSSVSWNRWSREVSTPNSNNRRTVTQSRNRKCSLSFDGLTKRETSTHNFEGKSAFIVHR